MGIVYKYDAVFGLTLTFDEIVVLVPQPKHIEVSKVERTIWSDVKWRATKKGLAHKAERKSPNY